MPGRPNKTVPTSASVSEFLSSVPDAARRADAEALCALMRGATGDEPVMWGASIVGFGRFHYRYASGREGDTAAVAFAPRARNLVLYITVEADKLEDQLRKLGPHERGVGCIYLKRLADVDLDVLRRLVAEAYAVRAG